MYLDQGRRPQHPQEIWSYVIKYSLCCLWGLHVRTVTVKQLLCNTWPCLQIVLYSCADLGTDYSLCLLLSTGADSIFHPVMSTDNVVPPIVPFRRLSPGVNRGWGCCWTPYNAQDGQPVTQNGLRGFQRCSEKPCPMPLLFKAWFLFCLTWELASQVYQVKLCIGEAWFKMVHACWMIHRD